MWNTMKVNKVQSHKNKILTAGKHNMENINLWRSDIK